MSRRATPTSTSCCAACRAWTARSSSTSAWCSTARRPTSSRRHGTSTASGWSPLDPRVDVDQVCEALAFVDGVCAGDDRGGEAARQPIGTRFGFLKAPRSTVVQPGPVHGGVTDDPARQLEHLLERARRVKVFLSDGRALRYWSSGTDGPVVLFFHGCPDTRRIAMTGGKAAYDAGVRLLAFNRPGYGSSTPTASTHTSVARDAVELLDLWGIEQVAVLGMSVGGIVRRRVRRDVSRTRHRAGAGRLPRATR